MTRHTLLLVIFLSFGASSCDTGFGQPCKLPETADFRRACMTVEAEEADDENAVIMESQASCAVKNFAGCETRICLVYRGSNPFCSERCSQDADCEGSAECRPLIGETDLDASACEPQGSFIPECYCVRKGDVR